jgi:hypothetical protein
MEYAFVWSAQHTILYHMHQSQSEIASTELATLCAPQYDRRLRRARHTVVIVPAIFTGS